MTQGPADNATDSPPSVLGAASVVQLTGVPLATIERLEGMGRRPRGRALERQTLLLLPGLDGTKAFFRPLLGQLPSAIRGIPLTYPDEGPYDYPALLELVRQTVASIDECYVLAASFSGPLAIMLAAAEPRKVRGLILAATFARGPSRKLARLRFAATGPLVWALRVARRVPVWARPPDDPLRRAKRETWSRVSAHGLAARARAALAVDAREQLRACNQPVLCVTFGQDKVVPHRCAEEIASIGRRVRLACLPGGHLGMFTDPLPLAAEVTRFVTGDSPPLGASTDHPLIASVLTTT